MLRSPFSKAGRIWAAGILGGWILAGVGSPAIAQNIAPEALPDETQNTVPETVREKPPVPEGEENDPFSDLTFLLATPLEVALLEPDADLPEGEVITEATIAESDLTIPSLWWADQQFGGKLLQTWLAYPGNEDTPQWVDLVVNRTVWDASDYLQRYSFVRNFGLAAQRFGFDTRVFNRQAELLGVYVCEQEVFEFSSEAIAEAESSESVTVAGGLIVDRNLLEIGECNILMNTEGAGALEVQSTLFGAP